MSLPQQPKKTPEEIAKLRESMGIIAEAPPREELALETLSAEISDVPLKPAPKARKSAKKKDSAVLVDGAVEETKRPRVSERTSQPRKTNKNKISEPEPEPEESNQKIVRSLRKSEQGPSTSTGSSQTNSNFSVFRHSEDEIREIRRMEAFMSRPQGEYLLPLAARRTHLVLGYIFAIVAGIGIFCYDLKIYYTAPLVVFALLIAGYIYRKKPLSKHHAAFIGVIAIFVAIFGALHYFPYLRYGT